MYIYLLIYIYIPTALWQCLPTASVDMPEFIHYRNTVMLFRLMLEPPARFRQSHNFPSLWFISHAEPEYNVRDVDPSGK